MTTDLERVLSEEEFCDELSNLRTYDIHYRSEADKIECDETELAMMRHDAALRALLREALEGWRADADDCLQQRVDNRVAEIRRAVFGEPKEGE